MEIDERVRAVEERSKSNTHRIDAFEKLADEMHSMAKSIAVMAQQLSHNNEHLDSLSTRVGELEKRPGALWDKLIGGIVGAAATGLVGAIVALLIR